MQVLWILALITVSACGGIADESAPQVADESDCCAHPMDASVPLDASLDATGVFSDAAGPLPYSRAWFNPVDNAQLAADAGLGLTVAQFDPTRSKGEVLSELAASLELVRWPLAERVPAEVRVDESQPAYSQQVTITPSAPLGEGRYALRLNPLPMRVNVWPREPVEGIVTSRFYVGSQLSVLRIDLCAKANGKTKVIVSFSEPIRAASPMVQVYDGATLVSCEVPLVFASGGVEALCAFEPTQPMQRVRLDGITSVKGGPLLTATGTAPDFTFATKPDGSGCHSFVP